jgi:hypothetical protein
MTKSILSVEAIIHNPQHNFSLVLLYIGQRVSPS